MNIAIESRNLTRRYGEKKALDSATFTVRENTITGLLGRNGSGKTTFMALATGQDRQTSGSVKIFGREPFEHAQTVEQMCFIRDNQRYPDDYKLKQTLRAASFSYPNWDGDYAARLIDMFRIPKTTQVRKFSRGQLSALGIVLGLASRATLTFFDEPYLGLDATARSIFYEELLNDFQQHPRTFVVSTHLIDEMDRLLERVIILDQGRVIQNADVEDLRGSAHEVMGKADQVDRYLASREVLQLRHVGSLATALVNGSADNERARTYDVDTQPVGLQDLVAAYGALEDLTTEGGVSS